jgi:hypothetical protein
MTTKTCSKCKQVKELACFPYRKYKGEMKLKAHCKDCQRELYRAWYNKNEDYAKAKRAEYVEKNKDEISRKRKKAYQENIEDMRKKDKESYRRNREKILARHKRKYEEDIEKSRAKGRERYWKNVEKNRERAKNYWKTPQGEVKKKEIYKRRYEKDPDFFKKYYRKNIDRYREHSARRRLLEKKASINLTEDHIKQMQNIYWLARDLTVINGEPYEVDHIIPIKGEDVCGLHVPWNLQILPKDLNRSKGNKYNEEDAFV